MIINRQPRLQFVPAESIETIHRASLRILAEIGYAFICEAALDAFEGMPGVRVDRDAERVYFDPTAVEAAVAQLPNTITVHARNPARTITLGGDNIIFVPTGSCPFTMDEERGRRTGRLADFIELARLSHALNELDYLGPPMTEPQDVPVPIRPAVNRYILARSTDKAARLGELAPSAGDISREIRGDFKTVVSALFGSDWDALARPVTLGSVNPISPLCYDDRMSWSLMNHASFGQPAMIAPAAIAGITAPMTLAGAMAQQNAEVLAGIMLCHTIRPGTPIVYGTVTTVGDMKVGAPVYGSVEHALCISMGAQLARKYGIPSRGGGVLSDAKLPDVQAGVERMLILLTTILTGHHYIHHGAGMLESFLTSSYELLVMDNDLLAMLRRLVEGVPVDDEQIAMEVIREVGPQGMFLTTEHTYNTFRGAYVEPRLFDRQMYNEWLKQGGRNTLQQATAYWNDLLRHAEDPPLDPLADECLRELIRRDEASIPAADREDWPRSLVGL